MLFRPATPDEFPALSTLIIDSFEPITWYKKIDAAFGPLNGCDWRRRWELRAHRVLNTQLILVGEIDSQVVAVCTGTVDQKIALGFIELLAVHPDHKGQGNGRLMLRAMLDHLKSHGAQFCHLECLTDNDRGNALYASEGWNLIAASNHYFVKID